VRRSRATNLQLVEVLEYIRPRVYGIESYPKFIEARDKINAAIEAAKG